MLVDSFQWRRRETKSSKEISAEKGGSFRFDCRRIAAIFGSVDDGGWPSSVAAWAGEVADQSNWSERGGVVNGVE